MDNWVFGFWSSGMAFWRLRRGEKVFFPFSPPKDGEGRYEGIYIHTSVL
jgi:hypothetical protein